MKFKYKVQTPFLLLALGYLFTRLINLLTIPIFNDESIYIDWGTKELGGNGLAFYSLYDGKPPFLMWIFGIFHKFIADPLLAGRLVSVIAGFLILLGIYKLGKKYFGEKTALLAGFFYILIPIFVFFDRQALMESAVGAVGVWSLYFFLEFLENPNIKYSIILGVIWGIGVFIKQSTLVFFITETIIFVWLLLRKKRGKFNLNFIWVLGVSQLVLLPLYLQKNFWTSFNSGSRFAMGIPQILAFPLDLWLKNLQGIVMIPFWYIFSPLLILAGFGIYRVKEKNQKLVRLFLLILLLIVLIFAIVVTPRYLVSYLPLLTIFAGFALSNFQPKKSILKTGVLLISIIFPGILTGLLIFAPLKYFETLKSLTSYSQEEGYVSDWTSGYATSQAISFLTSVSGESSIVVGVRVDAGNPESAVFAYFNNSKRVLPIYFDSKVIDPKILEFNCFTTNLPFYFVARDNTLAGMDKYLTKVAEYRNPVGDRFVGVYILKSGCPDGVLKITF